MISGTIWHMQLSKQTERVLIFGYLTAPVGVNQEGPWVNSKKAMRYLNHSETKIVGGTTQKIKLIKSKKEFQDVKAIAYPVGNKIFKQI